MTNKNSKITKHPTRMWLVYFAAASNVIPAKAGIQAFSPPEYPRRQNGVLCSDSYIFDI